MSVETPSGAVDVNDPEVRAQVGERLQERVVEITRGEGGGNNRLYRVLCAGGACYALKDYFRPEGPLLGRLRGEFGGLEFLWERGLRKTPRPVSADLEAGYALYSWVEGARPKPESLGVAEVDAGLDFLEELRGLCLAAAGAELPRAAEACFSLCELRENLAQRMARLEGFVERYAAEDAVYVELGAFLKEDFRPHLERFFTWAEGRYAELGRAPDALLGSEELTLSPSDFGFHNALRVEGGPLVWLDFEYFGWDDPAKAAVDFLHHPHPAMALSRELKTHWFRGFVARFSDPPDLSARIEAAYPLFGLKWIMILLNEFVPKLMQRRAFAEQDRINVTLRRKAQLKRARAWLQRLRTEHGKFPFSE